MPRGRFQHLVEELSTPSEMQSGCPCGVCSASLGKCSIPGDRSQGDSTHSQMGLLCSVFLGKESGLGRGRSLAATWAQQQPQPPPGGVCTEMAQQNHPKLGQKGQAFRPPFAAGFPIPICSGHRVQAAPGRAQSRQRQHLQLRISWKGLTAESCPDKFQFGDLGSTSLCPSREVFCIWCPATEEPTK